MPEWHGICLPRDYGLGAVYLLILLMLGIESAFAWLVMFVRALHLRHLRRPITMPERHKGEKLSKFIGRFVSSTREKRKFPKLKQRLAVGYAEARRSSHG